MELLICVEVDEPLNETSPWQVFRFVDWPTVPRLGEDVQPFARNEMDFSVGHLEHRFALGVIELSFNAHSGDNLAACLAGEEDYWLILTQLNTMPLADVVRHLRERANVFGA